MQVPGDGVVKDEQRRRKRLQRWDMFLLKLEMSETKQHSEGNISSNLPCIPSILVGVFENMMLNIIFRPKGKGVI